MSRLGACVDSTLTWIGNNKLSSFLIVCLFAFIVSTWTLAAINADLKRQINEKNSHPDDTKTTESTTTVSTTSESTTPISEGPHVNLRLSEFVKPTLYDLLLHPDLKTGRFSGNVKIELEITSDINEFALHSHLLNISSVKFSLSGSNVAVKDYEHIKKLEQLKIYLTDTVRRTNNSVLEISFTGSLEDKMIGFYKSIYKNPEGIDR